jgi:hypothetical protein
MYEQKADCENPAEHITGRETFRGDKQLLGKASRKSNMKTSHQGDKGIAWKGKVSLEDWGHFSLSRHHLPRDKKKKSLLPTESQEQWLMI